jgi:hypothetical protein
VSTPAEVAQWMANKVRTKRELYQDDAVAQIEKRFGADHVYDNANGNLAISKVVLTAFRKLTEADVIWVKSERFWRLRERGDEPSRRQDN